MAVSKTDIVSLCASLVGEAHKGVFRPVYLLMGEEPYYPELVCKAVLENCVDEFSKDFNELVCYGSDVDAEQVITASRRFPMMAERQLVVVKEAQLMQDLEKLSLYCSDPLDSTVLVIFMNKARADKRKALYKAVQNVGVVVDSPAVKDYEIANWISSYYSSRGLQIEPAAAALLGESVGTDISTIVLETEKLLKNLPEGTVRITAGDVEKNVGISRQFSVFELTKALSYANAAEAFRIAAHVGNAARFQMPAAISALYTHFYRILKYEALLSAVPHPSKEQTVSVLGVNPYFVREYDTAVRHYPLARTMKIISLLNEYDYRGKGGDGESSDDGRLLVELTAKILNS